MSEDFSSALSGRLRTGAPPAVVGLDPRPEALPEGLEGGDTPAQITAFYRRVLPTLARAVPAVKPNIAFFEAQGPGGYRAYERTCALARDAGLLVIGDVKRGDIGSTAEAYAREHFRHADALTLHPWMGRDSIEPFLRYCAEEGKGVFVLVRTSNPSADDFQTLALADGRRACDAVAEAVDRWGAGLGEPRGYSPVGAVVGATRPAELGHLRAAMPRAWLLLPGTGAQGGSVPELGAAFDAEGLGALITQSRSVMQCFSPTDPDWEHRLGEALERFAADCRAVVEQGEPGP